MHSPNLRTLSLLLAAALAGGCPSGPDEGSPASREVASSSIPITTSSEQARADFLEAQALLDVGRAKEARELFERAVEADPDFSMAYLSLANSAYSTQEYKDFLDRAFETVEGKSKGEQLLVEIAGTYLTSEVGERERLGTLLTEIYPTSPRAWLTLGHVEMNLSDQSKARRALERAIEIDPEFLGAYFALWNSYVFNLPRDLDRALEVMESARDIAPSEPQVYQNLGDTYRAREELEAARDFYGKAIERDPGGTVAATSSLKKGHINSFLGQFDEARKDYDHGIEGSNESEKPYYANYRAFAHLHADQPESALAELDDVLAAIEALDLPEDQKRGARKFTLTNAARIALHIGDLEKAEELLEQREAVLRADAAGVGDPNFDRKVEAEILLWRAQLEALSGDTETARASAEELRELRASENDPRRDEGYFGVVGMIAYLEGRFADAATALRQSNLANVYVEFYLARALLETGETEEAERLFREVGHWNFNSVEFALVRRAALAQLEG